MKKNLIICIVIGFLGCKTSKNLKKEAIIKNTDWKIESLTNYKNQEKVTFKIMNNNKNTLVVFEPFQKNIEKYDGENWVKVNTPYCPCGNCPPPPEVTSILPNENFNFSWDKNETSCIKNKKLSKKLSSGQYRVTINYGEQINVRTFKTVVIEFEI